jgi:tetratricopeptide (TPR) repeat protein
MTMTLARKLLLAAAVISIGGMSLAATPALAAQGGGGGGGGGGGSMPSASGVDAAKKYSEGVAFLQAKDYKKAEKAFDDVLEVAGRDANANYMMSLALIGQTDLKEARKFLRNTVRYDKNHILGRGWLGLVEAKLGDAGKANEQKTALVDMKTKCAGACPDAAKIDAAIAQIDGGLAAPDAPITLSGEMTQFASAKDGDAAYLTAFALINEGRYGDALYSLKSASLVFGPHPDVLTYQGFANRKLGNYSEAIGFYSAALKLDPKHRGANEYLGEYYVEMGQMGKAKAQLVKLDKICVFGCEQAEELRRWIADKESANKS